jgi:hypothetical protein
MPIVVRVARVREAVQLVAEIKLVEGRLEMLAHRFGRSGSVQLRAEEGYTYAWCRHPSHPATASAPTATRSSLIW